MAVALLAYAPDFTIWLSFTTTNSAGRSKEKPTRILTTPTNESVKIMVSESHLTK
jgi:hypothetical protein